MGVKYANTAYASLAAGINDTVTTITVDDASRFPSVAGASDYMYLTLIEGNTKEVVKVTDVTSNDLTVVRGQDNTSAAAFTSSAACQLRVTSAMLEDAFAEITSDNINSNEFVAGVDFTKGVTTSVDLSGSPVSVNAVYSVSFDGIVQHASDISSLVGNTLTFTAAIPADSVEVKWVNSLVIGVPGDNTVGEAQADTTELAALSIVNTWAAAQRGSNTQVAAEVGGNITLNMNSSNDFTLSDNAGNGSLGSDNSGVYTLVNPTNIAVGQSGSIFVNQDATGSRTLDYGTYFKWAGGTVGALSTAANSEDRIDYVVKSPTSIHIVLSKDIK